MHRAHKKYTNAKTRPSTAKQRGVHRRVDGGDHAARARVLLRAYCYELNEEPQAARGRAPTEGRGATDRTKYVLSTATNRNKTHSSITHHVQRISKAAVSYDSLAICKHVTVKKRKAYDN